MQTARHSRPAKAATLAAGLFSSSGRASAGTTQFRSPRKRVVNFKNFFAELQRRNVYKVAVAYGVVSWLLIQIATQVFPFFDIPSWTVRLIVVGLLLGFPVALILAWAYELTPEGIKLTDEVAPEKSIRRSTGRALDMVIIAVLLLVIAFFAWHRFAPSSTQGPPQKSIAVLPFVDLSQNKDQEYFSDGISEQIINALAKVRGLFVVARTSAFVFKNKVEDVRDVGNRLHVTHVLEGSVNRGGGKVRIDTRLINVTNGFQLWSESYDFTEEDVLSMQSDVAQKVTSALRVELHLAEATELKKPLSADTAAYDSYLRGRYLLNKRTVDSIQKARTLFELAVTKDPGFSLGHSGIADAYILLAEYGAITANEGSRAAWREAAKAIELDPQLAEGYISRAMLLTDFDWNWPAAEKDFLKAIDLNPNSVTAYHWYAFHLAQSGRFDEALRTIDKAVKLDPLSPIISAARARILWVARRPEEAIAQCHQALELETDFAPAFVILARAHVLRQEYPAAFEAAKRYSELSTHKFELAFVRAAEGNQTESDRLLTETSPDAAQRAPFDRAAISAVKGNYDEAARWLEAGIAEGNLAIAWIRVDPRLDHIRNDPRFAKLVEKVKPRRQP